MLIAIRRLLVSGLAPVCRQATTSRTCLHAGFHVTHLLVRRLPRHAPVGTHAWIQDTHLLVRRLLRHAPVRTHTWIQVTHLLARRLPHTNSVSSAQRFRQRYQSEFPQRPSTPGCDKCTFGTRHDFFVGTAQITINQCEFRSIKS